MTKYQKTKKDKDKERSDMENDPVLVFLKHREEVQFNVGDVLIKLVKNYDDKWEPEIVSDAMRIPRKYLYAFENELGIGYVKVFKSDGKLNEASTCITAFVGKDIKFALDPEYADHILLGEGEDFKPNNTYKEKRKFREKAITNNKKILIDSDPSNILAWLSQLKIGDVFYKGHRIPDMVSSKYKVAAIKEIAWTRLESYDREQYRKALNFGANDTIREITLEVVKHRWQDPGSKVTIKTLEFLNKSITVKEPFPLSENDK